MNFSRLSAFFDMKAKVGRLFGIPIFLHITIVFFLWPVLIKSGLGIPLMVEYSVAIVFCILLHELGHALAAKSYKLSGLSITLHGFGGFAVSSGYRSPKQQAIIVIAGPAVTFAVGGTALFLGNSGLHSAIPFSGEWFQFFLVRYLGVVNLWMGVLNLIPSFPFDGGMLVDALLSMKLPGRSATRAVGHLGLLITVPLAIYGFFWNQGFICIFGLMGFTGSLSVLLNTGGIRFGEVFRERRDRKADEAARKRAKAKTEAYVADVSARQREREEKERLRKLFEKSGIDD